MKICPACSREYPSESTHCYDDGVALVAVQAVGAARPEELLGHIVEGRYRVERIVGRGGMGVVYACRHVVVGKPAALKVLRVGVERAEGVLQRFIREAQTANAVKSRHIVEMTDFGQLPNGNCYVVMELLEGMSLTLAMRENRLSRADLLHIFMQMAETLHLVHAHGIVHRDLKPDNVFLVHENNDPLFVKLLDFGIAKAMHEPASGLTETGVILGTPYYMSPEQARGELVDGRTDIYALGVIMYRAFTGKLPFVAESMLGVLTRHLTEVPMPPSTVTEIDGLTEHVIMRCLEKDPAARFQTMGEVAAALATIAAPGAAPTLAMGSSVMSRPGRASYQGTMSSPGAPPPSYAPQTGSLQAVDFSAPSGSYGAAPTSSTLTNPQVTAGAYAQPGSAPPRITYGYEGAGASGLHAAPGSMAPGSGDFSSRSGIHGMPASVPPGSMAPGSGDFSSRSGIHGAPGAAISGVGLGVPLQTPVPELVTQRGLATSDTGGFRAAPPKRSNALVVGLPLAVLAAGGMIAVAIIMSRGATQAASGASSAEAALSAAPAPGSTSAAADHTAAGQGSATSPAGDTSAAAATTTTASASGSASAKSTRASGGGRPPPQTTKPAEPTSKPPGKRPEIRSPFE